MASVGMAAQRHEKGDGLLRLRFQAAFRCRQANDWLLLARCFARFQAALVCRVLGFLI